MADRHAGHGYGHRSHPRGPYGKPAKRPGQVDPQDSAPGICRICRSEGTPEEPLFYPCRCSGSIQHVHQDCLMEWLSHSQKKYCELCKTPFRFTKFYNPNMPQSLPVSVFFRQVLRYIIENSLGWVRAIIAIGFWVTVLPWFMRRGWSSMLWLSQESWGSTPGDTDTASHTSGSTIHLSSTMLGLDMCPSSPLFAPTSTPAADMETMLAWWGGQTLSGFLLRVLCKLTGLPLPSLDATLQDSNVSAARSVSALPHNEQSLLGNIQFLRTLTRSDAVNQTVVAVLEGQMITVVVIVSFILVILVRDYVVQQQPEINVRVGFEAPEEGEQAPVAVQPARPPQADETDDSDNDDFGFEDQEGLQHRFGAQRANHIRHHRPPPAESFTDESHSESPEGSASTPLNNVQEVHGGTAGNSYNHHGDSSSNPTLLNSWAEIPTSNRRLSDEDSADTILTPDYSQNDPAELSSAREAKGKEKFKPPPEELQPWSFPLHETEVGTSRPRSVSDGPQVHTNVNPLANNTWSFTTNPVEQASDDRGTAHPQLQPFPWQGSPLGVPGQVGDGHGPTHPTPPPDNSNNIRGDANEGVDQPLVETPLPQDYLTVAPATPSEQRAVPVDNGKNATDRIADFMWGDIEVASHDVVAADGEVDEDGADDGQWFDIPMDAGDDIDDHHHDEDIDVADVDVDAGDGDVDGVPGAGMDPEAIEDMEDFEGIMELLGMRGPITNLFQNVIFCAVLVQTALFVCIFIPFNVGRITFWITAKPIRLVRILFELSKVIQDLFFVAGGFLSWAAFNLVDMVTEHVGGSVAAQVLAARKGSWGFFTGAASRVGTFLELIFLDVSMSSSGMQYWSAVSHEALMSIKSEIVAYILWVGEFISTVWTQASDPIGLGLKTPGAIGGFVSGVLSMFSSPGSWVVELPTDNASSVHLANAHWPSGDITWAILAGYITVFALAGLYLKSGIRFTRGTALEDWEAGVVDSLHQASGILKVITIISIEMLVFPLYCGLLLDCALLPLFGGASLKSRLLFTYNNPWTSIFVHWFVGTGYMFHFALFVSMCRKIMRPGVLYFIRDPDDPEFHPVRDVLERNLTTQLRKILFSAFVYGALVVVCLGGVVWGLAFMAPSVLPIHYSSNEPVLEFPVDLLFYNFFMPLAVRVFKPGDALHTMYRWCFRKSARVLRLTYFLFGERRIDEEGTLQLPQNSPPANTPIYRQAFLGLDANKEKVIPKAWKDIFDGVDTRSSKSPPREIRRLRIRKARLVESGQLIKDGRFVRAPASDRVKIPKGRRVFLDVDERGRRTDGQPDEGPYASDQFQMVYIPPHFLTRIFLFILFIWTFAAVTGVGLTILPLVLGRMMFKMAIPNHVRTNDIYAFCIGIHVLGFAAYSLFHIHRLWSKVWSWHHTAHDSNVELKSIWRLTKSFIWGSKMVYTYTCILIVCPLLISVLVELYITIPIHTLMNPPTTPAGEGSGHGQHTIRIVESWTLGLLYMRLAVKFVTAFLGNTRFAAAMRVVFVRGWLEPNAGLLTRAFVVPGVVVGAAAVFGPSLFVRLLELQDVLPSSSQLASQSVDRVIRYRQAYPILLVLAILMRYGMVMKGGFDSLKAQIRDDAYLMGERLQNYDGSF